MTCIGIRTQHQREYDPIRKAHVRNAITMTTSNNIRSELQTIYIPINTDGDMLWYITMLIECILAHVCAQNTCAFAHIHTRNSHVENSQTCGLQTRIHPFAPLFIRNTRTCNLLIYTHKHTHSVRYRRRYSHTQINK